VYKMGYICLDCGNESFFNAEQEVTEYRTEQIIIDNEGSIADYVDSEVNDSETTEGPQEVICRGCDSCNVEFLEGEELEEARRRFSEPEDVRITNWKEEFEK